MTQSDKTRPAFLDQPETRRLEFKEAIFDDMQEITSPGPLPDALPVEELGTGRSEIRNRVLAPIFKELKLIEAWGSGIQKMHDELTEYPEIELILQEAGQAFQVQFVKKDAISQPESGQGRGRVGAESQPESLRQRVLICLVSGALSKAEISSILGQKEISGQLNKIVRELLSKGYIEYTIPDKPNSRLQKYRLTKKGEQVVK